MSRRPAPVSDTIRHIAHQYGAEVNQEGGIYQQGKSYGYATKIRVAAAYRMASTALGGGRPNIVKLQRECRVSRTYVKKIESELRKYDTILTQSAIRAKREVPVGPGSIALDEIDSAVILFLYLEEPSRSLKSYVWNLELLTGTIVSRSTISRWFKDAFPHRGGLCRPNLVPYDKFRRANIEKAIEYVEMIAFIDPERIKFGDEKHLKGDEVFNRKVRRNVLTGEVPEMVVSPDFRNRYNLTGFCSISKTTTRQAVWCRLHECINDADNFALDLEYAIQEGFFRGGDVLVLDNAAIHVGKENTVLEEYLWDTYGIFLLFLPARAPELNPMEQVWNCGTQGLKDDMLLPLHEVRKAGAHATAYAFIGIMNKISHDQVRRFYVGSGLLYE